MCIFIKDMFKIPLRFFDKKKLAFVLLIFFSGSFIFLKVGKRVKNTFYQVFELKISWTIR